jgi:hypothetical protein
MTLQLAPASPHRRLAGVLLCAMLLMQMVGLWHGVVHAHGPGHASHEGQTTLPEPSGPEGAFAHHDDEADCQVFDQLTHADATGWARRDPRVEHPALPRWHARVPPDVLARVSGFFARGPPTPA